MSKIMDVYELEVNEYRQRILINLYKGKNKSFNINISLKNGSWVWNYESYFIDHWFHFNLISGEFLLDRFFIDHPFCNSGEVTKEANDAYYELIRMLKNEPKWRLKLLNRLDNEIKEIWNEV